MLTCRHTRCPRSNSGNSSRNNVNRSDGKRSFGNRSLDNRFFSNCSTIHHPHNPNRTVPSRIHPTTNQETSQPSPKQTLVAPLDISPISVYKAHETRAGAGDEESIDEGRTAETKEGADDIVGEQTEGDKKKEAETSATQEENEARDGEATGEGKLNETPGSKA